MDGEEAQPAFAIPSDHFLAQQGKATSRLLPPSTCSSSQEAGPSSSPSPTPVDGLDAIAHLLSSAPPQAAASSTSIASPIPDTSTLAGADFDIDVRSGFLPPEAPVSRLPSHLPEYTWELMLDSARTVGLQINGGGAAVDEEHRRRCRAWRRAVREMNVVEELSDKLRHDIRYARRGHVVLTYLAHYYLHSQPQPSKLAMEMEEMERNAESQQAAAASSSSSSSSWFSSALRWRRNDNAVATAAATTSSPEELNDIADLRHEALGHYATRLPASISVPLLLLSTQLDLPPVLTYADTVLWNWALINPTLGLRPDNLRILETFSGTRDEEHFFLTSLIIELQGVAALGLMRASLDECFVADELARRRVAAYLTKLVGVVKELEGTLRDVRKECDPATFYWAIRPWFRGGDSAPFGGKGWIYPSSREEEEHGEGLEPKLFTGPSAGQSSLIHALDVFLDVDHAGVKGHGHGHGAQPQQRRARGDANEDGTFMQRMQLYMPGQHRRFLTHLQSLAAAAFEEEQAEERRRSGSHDGDEDGMDLDDDAESQAPSPAHPSPIRHLALTTSPPTHPLPLAYNSSLTSLRSLRDEHMRVATLYIVSQSRRPPPPAYAPLLEDEAAQREYVRGVGRTLQPGVVDELIKRKEEEEGMGKGKKGGEGVKGTGGTDLVRFLKACRMRTDEAMLIGREQ